MWTARKHINPTHRLRKYEETRIGDAGGSLALPSRRAQFIVRPGFHAIGGVWRRQPAAGNTGGCRDNHNPYLRKIRYINMLLSNYIRDVRMNKIRPYVRGDVLDVGCGRATIWEKFGDRIDTYVGVDRNSRLVEELKGKFPDADFRAMDLDEGRLGFDKKFDTILMIAIIEHVFNQKHLFREVIRHLKPGGSIVVTTPTPFGNDIIHHLGTVIGLFAKTAADDHIVIYNKKRFEIVAKEFDLRLERYESFAFGCNQLAILKMH